MSFGVFFAVQQPWKAKTQKKDSFAIPDSTQDEILAGSWVSLPNAMKRTWDNF